MPIFYSVVVYLLNGNLHYITKHWKKVDLRLFVFIDIYNLFLQTISLKYVFIVLYICSKPFFIHHNNKVIFRSGCSLYYMFDLFLDFMKRIVEKSVHISIFEGFKQA